jgi:peptidoglycan/xylan/chitin deacetylase (PgdA/CDA1 family)
VFSSLPVRAALGLALALALVGPALTAVTGTGDVVEASSGPTFATHGSRATKTIAITIDDCDNEMAVTALLKIVRDAHVNATWFCIGKVVAADPAFWKNWALAGYPMANHTYYHTSLTAKSYSAIVAELKLDNSVVTRIIGRPMLPVLRPMGGNVNSTVIAAAGAAGEKLVLNWDVSICDTSVLTQHTVAAIARYVAQLTLNGERGTNGSVILMHAKGPYTQQALPAILAYYQARGYQFVTVGQMFGLGGVVPFPAQVSRSASTPIPGNPTPIIWR